MTFVTNATMTVHSVGATLHVALHAPPVFAHCLWMHFVCHSWHVSGPLVIVSHPSLGTHPTAPQGMMLCLAVARALQAYAAHAAPFISTFVSDVHWHSAHFLNPLVPMACLLLPPLLRCCCHCCFREAICSHPRST